ncbi:UNVERIFIED_CONTAM: hypothetical protein Scaly_2835800 [Sesamum calycinum]|uniref:Uncharacterized protein n=1 Tax=Sesamum calycinum TaxID=2727403 RepID=A0AAW2IRD4_9LAMI
MQMKYPRGTLQQVRKNIKMEEEPKGGRGMPPKVELVEELLNIEPIPGDPEKITRMGSQMDDATRKEIIQCLQHDIDIFAWILQDLEGIDPSVITHHSNIDLNMKPVKHEKRHFRCEKDKIIQADVDKLMAAGHIEEIQFPEWLSTLFWYLNLEEGGVH